MDSNKIEIGSYTHEEIWDDTALIQAYDKALGLAKKGLRIEAKDKKRQVCSKNKKNKSKPKSYKWKIGDSCEAIYSVDRLYYPAIIKSINEDSTCVVVFDGYENEENVDMSTLLKTSKKQLETDQDIISDELRNMNLSHDNRRTNSSPSFFPPPSTLPSFEMPKVSAIPSPPEPYLDADYPDDVLASTLISWRMCGVHTGFYQAMRHFQTRTMSVIPSPSIPCVNDALSATFNSWYMSGFNAGVYQAMFSLQQKSKK